MQDFNFIITKEIKENTIVMNPETWQKFKKELEKLYLLITKDAKTI